MLSVLLLLTFYHISALWLFTKGFLLARVELQGQNECFKQPTSAWNPPVAPSEFDRASLSRWADLINSATGAGECTLPPTHSKAVVFIIDALRYDFIAPIVPISTSDNSSESSWRPDPYYHAKLSLPADVHAMNPSSSFLAHFLADAPTTTLQRLKGLTTGTLPTFIEAGANFGGMGKVQEDNWLQQLKLKAIREGSNADGHAGLAFAGDDTWATVFPSVFDQGKVWAYDSFNVEDLDTVDAGVQDKLLPFLQPNHPDRTEIHENWRLLIGHGLGVDHVGHRFGASHPKMEVKMAEMQAFLRNITDAVDNDTLVILMGDHGMDERGDHGGDGELEVGAGIWVWSRSGFGPQGDSQESAALLSDSAIEELVPSFVPFSPLPSPPFESRGHRSIPQIDLVPSLSLLLGIPVPFNSLGSIVPELFPNSDRLLRALRINARQIKTYLDSYAAESSDLKPFAKELEHLWYDAIEADARYARAEATARAQKELVQAARLSAAKAYHRFNRASLVRARSVWAQFELSRIYLGLTLLALSLASAWLLWSACQKGLLGTFDTETELGGSAASPTTIQKIWRTSKNAEELRAAVFDCAGWPLLYGAAIGSALFAVQRMALPSSIVQLSLLDMAIFGSSSASQAFLLVKQRQTFFSGVTSSNIKLSTSARAMQILGFVLPLVHALLFASNSFTVWEDKVTLALLISALLARFALSFGAPTSRLTIRMPIVAAIAITLARLASISHVCREEQGPSCVSRFYAEGADVKDGAGGSAALNSPYVIAGSYVAAFFLPSLVSAALSSSKSNVGVAPIFFQWLLRPSLLAGAGYWLGDWALPSERLTPGLRERIEWLKNLAAKTDLIVICVIGLAFWIFTPLCLELRREQTPASASASQQQGKEEGNKTRVTILGYANSLGSSYLLLVTLVYSALFLLSQPAGQLALTLCLLVTIANAELGDCERDCQIITSQLEKNEKAAAADGAKGRKSRDDKRQAKVDPLVSATEAASGPGGNATAVPASPFPSLIETSCLVLIGFLAFFSTGHQATISSIQWRVAFVGFKTVTYPWSPLFVVLNSFGPLLLLPAISVPLLCVWNLAPRPRGSTSGPMNLPVSLLRTSLAVILYHTLLTLSAAGFAGLLFRRHLMLFKIWTPRYMLGAVSLIGTDVTLLLAVLATWQVGNKVNRVFGTAFA